jgi:hypothetical protein
VDNEPALSFDLRLDEVVCAACRREASVVVAEREGWACRLDIAGEPHALCVECAERATAVGVPRRLRLVAPATESLDGAD